MHDKDRNGEKLGPVGAKKTTSAQENYDNNSNSNGHCRIRHEKSE